MNEDWKKDSMKIVERWARGDDPWGPHTLPPTPTQVWVWLIIPAYLLGVGVGYIVGRWMGAL